MARAAQLFSDILLCNDLFHIGPGGRDDPPSTTTLDKLVYWPLLEAMRNWRHEQYELQQKQKLSISRLIYAHQMQVSIGGCINDLELIAKLSSAEDLANHVSSSRFNEELCYHQCMRTSVSIDELGRLTLPKRIREAVGIRGKTTVQVEVINKAAVIRAENVSSEPFIQHGNRLVYAGKLPNDWHSGYVVLNVRERNVNRPGKAPK